MGGIFISYRREDASGWANHLEDSLRAHFGEQSVFFDIDGIQPGVDFVQAIDDAVNSCDAMLVLIGPHWLNAADRKSGGRRLDDPNDFIVLEISAALQKKKTVIPVLLGNAEMPTENDLPEAIRPLAKHQASDLTDKRWDYDFTQLRNALERHVRKPAGALPVKYLAAAIAAIAMIAVVGTLYLRSGPLDPRPRDESTTPEAGQATANPRAPEGAGSAVQQQQAEARRIAAEERRQATAGAADDATQQRERRAEAATNRAQAAATRDAAGDDRDRRTGRPATSVDVPELTRPPAGELVDNGCRGTEDPVNWLFTWKPVTGASRYHLTVAGPHATRPWIDEAELTEIHFSRNTGRPIGPGIATGWRWRVRAEVNGSWRPWSEERVFNVEPLGSDCR